MSFGFVDFERKKNMTNCLAFSVSAEVQSCHFSLFIMSELAGKKGYVEIKVGIKKSRRSVHKVEINKQPV